MIQFVLVYFSSSVLVHIMYTVPEIFLNHLFYTKCIIYKIFRVVHKNRKISAPEMFTSLTDEQQRAMCKQTCLEQYSIQGEEGGK